VKRSHPELVSALAVPSRQDHGQKSKASSISGIAYAGSSLGARVKKIGKASHVAALNLVRAWA
jgi:hypothetical protein